MTNVKSPKANPLAYELIERNSSVLDEIASKALYKEEDGDRKRKSK